MKVYQTIKRRMLRSTGSVLHPGFSGGTDDGPGLMVSLPDGYSVTISFRDLAELVRAADKYTSPRESVTLPGMPGETRRIEPPTCDLPNWRDLK